MRSTSLAAAILLALVVAAPAKAWAGNSETAPFGPDAALLAGAATAVSRGAAAVWYNPARIGVGREDELDVGASAYMLRVGGTPELRALDGRGVTRTKLSSLDVGAVPTVIAYRRRVFGLELSAGLFSPTQSASFPRTLVRYTEQASGRQDEVAFDGNSRFTEYYAGLGAASELTSTLRLGLAVYGYYSRRVDSTSSAIRSRDRIFFNSGTRDEELFGGQFVLGLAWTPVRRLSLGFTLRSPVLQLASRVQQTQFIASGSPSSSNAVVVFDEKPLGAEPSLLVPLAASVGAAVDVGKDAEVSVDLRGRGSLQGDRPEQRRRPTLDVRIGARRRFGDAFAIGGGVYTDLSAVRPTSTEPSIDYYGLSAGMELGRTFHATSEGKPGEGILRFSTTITVSYAYGRGSVGNLLVSPQGDRLVIESTRADVTAHELMLNIGTALGIGPLK